MVRKENCRKDKSTCRKINSKHRGRISSPYCSIYEVIYINNDELLKCALENGMIDMSYIQEQIEMKKREELLARHPYQIWEGKDGKWRTYITDETKQNGRRMVKKSSREELINDIIKYQKSLSENKIKTFKDAYFQWREYQDQMVSDNSIYRYKTDYKRFFENTDFEKEEISEMTIQDIKVFIKKSVESSKLCKKACKTLCGYIKNTFASAKINKVISENPVSDMVVKDFYQYCFDKPKKVSERIINDGDLSLLYERFELDYKKQPNYIPTYAVEMASLTGMRVGELSALRWDSISEDYAVADK